MLASLTKTLSKIISFFLIPIKSVTGQSIAEFAVITAMMSTFVATAPIALLNASEVAFSPYAMNFVPGAWSSKGVVVEAGEVCLSASIPVVILPTRRLYNL